MMSNNTMNENMDMSMDPMMPMPMFMYWTSECWFIFKTWYTNKDDHGLFVLGCFLAVFFNIVMFSLPFIQRRLFPVSLGIKGDRYSLKFECELHNFKSCHNTNYMELDNNEKTERKKGIKDIFIGLVFFFLTFIMSCFNMLLLMTFNGWLIFSIVIGACLGYLGGEITNMIRKSTA